MITRYKQPQSRDAVTSPDLVSESFEQPHGLVTSQKTRVNQEHWFFRRTEMLFNERHRSFHQDHELIPFPVARGRVGIDDRVPPGTRLVDDLPQGVQEQPLEICCGEVS